MILYLPPNRKHYSVPNSIHRAHRGLMERTAIPMEPYGTAMIEKGTEKEPLLVVNRSNET